MAAWRRNEAVFDDIPLSAAVAEMNRYRRRPIVLIGDESSKSLRISGLFWTGDNVAIARAVSALHDLVVHIAEITWSLRPCRGELKSLRSRLPDPVVAK